MDISNKSSEGETDSYEFLDDISAEPKEMMMEVEALIIEEKHILQKLGFRKKQLVEVLKSRSNNESEKSSNIEISDKISEEDLSKLWKQNITAEMIKNVEKLGTFKSKFEKFNNLKKQLEIVEIVNQILLLSSESSIDSTTIKLCEHFPKLNEFPRVQVWMMKKIESHLNMIREGMKSKLMNHLKFWNWGIPEFKIPQTSGILHFSNLQKLLKGLILLQIIRDFCRSPKSPNFRDPPPDLEIMDFLSHDLLLRLNFHFFGNKQSNQTDRPTFLFTYIEIIRESYIPILQSFLSPILRHFYRNYPHLFLGVDVQESEFETSRIRYFKEPSITFTNQLNSVILKRVRNELDFWGKLYLEKVDDLTNESNDKTEEEIFQAWMNHLINYEQAIVQEFSYFGNAKDRGYISVFTEVLKTPGNYKNTEEKSTKKIFAIFLQLETTKIENFLKYILNSWTAFNDLDRILENGKNYDVDIDDSDFEMNRQKPSKSVWVVINKLSMLNERYGRIENLGMRTMIFEKIHYFVFVELLNFFSKFVNKHLKCAEFGKEKPEWKYFCSVMNSTLYCVFNLRLWDEIPYIMDLVDHKITQKARRESSGINRILFFSSLADRLMNCVDGMTNKMIDSILEYIKFFTTKKYEKKLDFGKEDTSHSVEIQKLGKAISKILDFVNLSLEKLRFSKFWRMLIARIDFFVISHFKMKKYISGRAVEKIDEKSEMVVKDMKLFFEIILKKYSAKSVNYAKNLKEIYVKYIK